MNRFLILLVAILFSAAGFSQSTQTIRGTVVDAVSKSPLPGVIVMLFKDSLRLKPAVTDVNGVFRFADVHVGRYDLQARFTGYQTLYASNLILTAGKELVLNLEMEELVINKQEVVITADKKEGTVNEMATGSGRMFSVEETNRYAGSRGDPARMASNFAGVQGADDSRNDIVVRGNSPSGVLWRVEGVDIPNPNHFAIEGTTGGPVSILNNKVLSNSDFFTGAFAAEYGNSIAAAFDLRMRNGNNEKFEFNGQFGFLGTELSAEGPLKKSSGASFLVNYRYSTLRMFEAANIPIGTGAVPSYMDGAFKLNFPLKNGGNLSWFGIGGNSKIDIIVSEYTAYADELYGEDSRDQYFRSGMFVSGVVYAKPLNETTFFRAVVAGSRRYSSAHHDLVWRSPSFNLDSITPKMGYRNDEDRVSMNWYISKKLSSRTTLKAGMFNDLYRNTLQDSIHSEVTFLFYNRQDYSGSSFLIQPYAQLRFRPNDKLTLNAGLHGQYFTLNGSTAVEPRLGMRYAINDLISVHVGVGMHSQMLPAYVYYSHRASLTADNNLHNKNLDFIRSYHSVVGYDRILSESMRLKVEAYYQYLYDVPVDVAASSFSVLNQGTGFSRYFPDSLVNSGTGQNYGVELTLEKFFSKNYFFMTTLSLFDATYKGSDGVTRNTDFNTRYAFNALAGKEFKINDKQTIQLGTKLTMAGKRWYTPIDTAASAIENDEVLVDSLRNTVQFSRSYLRLDIRVVWRMNTKKLTHEIGIDVVNVLNRKNILGLTYSPNPVTPSTNPVVEQYQLGLLPLFYYSIDF